MPKVSQQHPFLRTQQDSTFLLILAAPNDADFWICSTLTSIPRFSVYFSNFAVIVPNAPTTIGITTTFFICYNLATSSFSKLYFLIFSLSLSHTLVFPGIFTSIIIVSFFTYQLPQYLVFWLLSCDHTVRWNPI